MRESTPRINCAMNTPISLTNLIQRNFLRNVSIEVLTPNNLQRIVRIVLNARYIIAIITNVRANRLAIISTMTINHDDQTNTLKTGGYNPILTVHNIRI